MQIGKVRIYRLGLRFVCNFVCVCTVKDFSAEDKANGVKFHTVIYRRPRQGISHFGELCSLKVPTGSQSRTNRPARWPRALASQLAGQLARAGPRAWPIRPAHWPRVGSACVDIRPSPKTGVLVLYFCRIILLSIVHYL